MKHRFSRIMRKAQLGEREPRVDFAKRTQLETSIPKPETVPENCQITDFEVNTPTKRRWQVQSENYRTKPTDLLWSKRDRPGMERRATRIAEISKRTHSRRPRAEDAEIPKKSEGRINSVPKRFHLNDLQHFYQTKPSARRWERACLCGSPENYETNPITPWIADFRISDLRLGGVGGPKPPLQVFFETKPFRSFVFFVSSWTPGKLPNEPNRPFRPLNMYMHECRDQQTGQA
jgi:hypothetical protein